MTGRLLAGKVVLVVGAGPGLGRQAARLAATEGASVVVTGRSGASLDGIVAEIASGGGAATAIVADVTSDADCGAAVAHAESTYGGLDVVVFNAYHPGSMNVHIEHASTEVWRAAFDVNVLGAMRVARAAIPALRRRRGGSIIAISSQIARRSLPGRGDYTTSKAALLALVEVLAKELGPDGIRVNALVPGRMRGPAFDENLRGKAAAAGVTFDELEQSIAAQLSLARIPTDEETARSILYLASSLSAGMTGQALDVNGGETFRAL
ncbi:MAG TPA: SDR family oxidoreductase [Acidimicrobiales bacterium]|jgi:NAD(P)-dependent dehydrogenase (short-subunit alcohol dehydrogenase family)|nr:SDR family oxidoreductase [Acidimicrobiales bacterium]